MQIEYPWHLFDTESGRLIKGYPTYVEAEEAAEEAAKANSTKMFVIMETRGFFRLKSEVERLDPANFQN